MAENFEKKVQIVNKRGLHARAAAKFVKTVESFDAEVLVAKDGDDVTGSSLMGLLMLGASIETHITIRTSGAEAKQALDELAGLVERGFDEE